MDLLHEVKELAKKVIEEEKSGLEGISLQIHGKPELAWEEFFAHQILTDYLEKKGFIVERGYKGIATAFKATAGSGSPVIAVHF